MSASIPLQSGQVFVEEGRNVTLTCTMTETYRSNYTVDDIYFLTSHKIADGSPYNRIASNTSVELQIPQVTEEWEGIVFCLVPDMTDGCQYFSPALTIWINVISKCQYFWSSYKCRKCSDI